MIPSETCNPLVACLKYLVKSPCCLIRCDCHTAGEMNSVTYLWEGTSLQTHQMAALAGQCSLLQSESDSFLNNFAIVGGGAIYATNATSLMLRCTGSKAVSSTIACTDWADNGVQAQTQGNGLGMQVCRNT